LALACEMRTDESFDDTPKLAGHWRVERQAGFLPPFGITKRIGENGRGWTCVAGLPLLPFRVTDSSRADRELRYSFLPIRDELMRLGPSWAGRGLIFGREFCRFRLCRPW
jgi:hypothetical protein